MTKSDMEFRGRHEWIADMLCGAWASLMAAADVAKMLEEEEKI